jgi:hypothetical protein
MFNNKISKDFRLEKYLGVLGYKENYTFPLNEDALKNFIFGGPNSNPAIGNSKKVQTEDISRQFPDNITDYLGLYHFGDIRTEIPYPTITKSRPFNRKKQSNNILTYIEINRHWENVKLQMNNQIDIPWNNKKNKMIWRGGLTNTFSKTNPRLTLVKQFIDHDKIDVGLTQIFWSDYFSEKYIKPRMIIEEMLSYKYIISLEGNDVASNLKWIMYSKSLVIMPIPTRESWFLESCLIPWVHFIPISETMGDLEEKLEWCISNDNKCQQIVENANLYVSNFLNFEDEKNLSTQVIEAYCNRLTFTCDKNLRQKYGHLLQNKKNVEFL